MRFIAIALVTVLPTLVLSLDRCNNKSPSCSSCSSKQICIGTIDFEPADEGLFRRDMTYDCENYLSGYHCCKQADCPSGGCENNICKDGHIVNKKCTQDYECVGEGGYCCVKTGLCGGANSCD